MTGLRALSAVCWFVLRWTEARRLGEKQVQRITSKKLAMNEMDLPIDKNLVPPVLKKQQQQ